MIAAIKAESSPDTVRRVQRLEDRSDKCYREIALLRSPWNLAVRRALTETIRVVETSVPAAFYATETQVNVVLNASRVAAQLYSFARNYGNRENLISDAFEWGPRVAIQAHVIGDN